MLFGMIAGAIGIPHSHFDIHTYICLVGSLGVGIITCRGQVSTRNWTVYSGLLSEPRFLLNLHDADLLHFVLLLAFNSLLHL
jgi:hypothetical protein